MLKIYNTLGRHIQDYKKSDESNYTDKPNYINKSIMIYFILNEGSYVRTKGV